MRLQKRRSSAAPAGDQLPEGHSRLCHSTVSPPHRHGAAVPAVVAAKQCDLLDPAAMRTAAYVHNGLDGGGELAV
jgi:hypothetical protein